MGIFLISILLLTSLQTSYPSFPGIIKSKKIKLGFSSIAILTASIPLFAVNTEKGDEFLDKIKEELFLKETDLETAFSYNHHCNVSQHKKRNEFFEKIANKQINEDNIINYMNKYTRRPLYRRILGKVKKIVKKIIK